MNYDAILVTSFGGPERPDDVMPFLENVLRGKNVPRERMLEVAEHYYHFGGKSPINDQNRQLIAALEAELARHGPCLPIYWGNRNWHPMLTDTLCQMKADGVRRALAFVTSAYSSYLMVVPASQFDTPGQHFRVGLGRRNFAEALERVEEGLGSYM